MRLFKRRSLDQSPELVSATPISHDVQATTTTTSASVTSSAMPPPAARAPKIVQRQARTPPSTSTLRRTVNSPGSKQQREGRPNSAPFTPPQLPRKLESQPKLKSTPLSFSAKSLSSLGKKVGEKWHQLKRADSSELLSTSKKVAKKQNDDASTTPTSSPDLGKTKRVGRIESLRNLFRSTSSSSLSGATSRSSSKNRSSTGDESLERSNSDSGQQLEKSLSEGMLKPLTRPRAELERKRLELLRDIQEMERQNRLFEFILSDEKTIKTNEGCSIARRVMQETDSTIMRRRQLRRVDAEMMHRERKASDGSDLSGRRSNRTSASSNELRTPALVADPFDEEHGLVDDLVVDPRRESVRSCELKGLEDLMSALKLGGGDESGYDTESTRNGADSPDSGASVPITTSSTARNSVALVDCEGIDLSIIPLDSPNKQQQQQQQQKQRQAPPRKKRLRSEGISEETEHQDHLVSPSERYQNDATLVAEDDNPNDTARTETTILAVTDLTQEAPKTPKKHQPTPLRQRLSFRTQRQDQQGRTPEKKRPAPEVPPRSTSRVTQKNPLLRSCSKAANRRLSNASLLNLLDNASSPSKDSPPKVKLPLSTSTPSRPRYYNPKRSHAELEADEVDNSPMAASSPVEATPAKSKLRRPIFDRNSVSRCPSSGTSSPLVRRELKTMKLKVDRAGGLGLSVHRCEAARPYYVVSALDEQGEAAKSKFFRLGDEVVRVCGRRLRGMSLAEARHALRSCQGDVELQIAREPNFYFGKEPGDTWDRPKLDEAEQVTKSQSEVEVWGPMTLKPGSPVRLEFEDEAMTEAGEERREMECVAEESISCSQQSTIVDDEDKDAEMGDDEADDACEVVGAITKDGRRLSATEMECPNAAVISVDEPKPTSGMLKFQVRRRSNTVSSDQDGIRRRAASMSMDVLTIELDKGAKQALGFTVVGGADSPNGAMGIYIKSILPGGQASEQGLLRAKDEILAVNGQSLDGLTHAEAVHLIKTAKKGKLVLHVARRDASAPTRTRLISSRSGL